MAIFTIVMGALFSISRSIGDTATLQEVRLTNVDEGRRALLLLVPRLRQAQKLSINMESMPTDILRFRMPEDLDGNGLAVDGGNQLELGDEITVRRDVGDLNKDGHGSSQLIMLQGDTFTVLANNLSPDEAPNGVGSAPSGIQTVDGTEARHPGFWVEVVDGRLSITINTQGESRQGQVIRQRFTQLVEARN